MLEIRLRPLSPWLSLLSRLNIINLKMSGIKKLDTKTRKLFATKQMNHPKADVERIYLPREVGGRRLTQLETQLELTYKSTTAGLKVYLEQTEDQLLKLLYEHERRKNSTQYQRMPTSLRESKRYQN